MSVKKCRIILKRPVAYRKSKIYITMKYNKYVKWNSYHKERCVSKIKINNFAKIKDSSCRDNMWYTDVENLINGKWYGNRVLYVNTNKHMDYLINDKKNGVCVLIYCCSLGHDESYFIDGKKNGAYKNYDSSGFLTRSDYYIDDKNIWSKQHSKCNIL